MSHSVDHPATSPDELSATVVREELQQFATVFDQHFTTCLAGSEEVSARLSAAITYSALSAGKRIRPYLVVQCCELVGGDRGLAWKSAAAVECVHVFSLIHDDLPAMDDDDTRRGQPTCHKKFDEATAVLAGDALLAFAFELLTNDPVDSQLACKAVRELAVATGSAGMIGGQMADITGEQEPASIEMTKLIHAKKTARLIEASCHLGALVGGATPEQLAQLCRFGQYLGMCFQITDDLLDVTGSADKVGKSTQKDHVTGKQTYPQCVGIEKTQQAAKVAGTAAIDTLKPFGHQADALRRLAQFVVHRNF